MSKNRVYILLDRSASMSAQWSDTLGAVNGYVKALPFDTNVYLATFDSPCRAHWNPMETDYFAYDVIRNTVAGEWKEVTGAEVIASNGLVVNSKTVSASYSIPSGSNAMSTGPVTVASGQSVTVPTGSRWVVI